MSHLLSYINTFQVSTSLFPGACFPVQSCPFCLSKVTFHCVLSNPPSWPPLAWHCLFCLGISVCVSRNWPPIFPFFVQLTTDPFLTPIFYQTSEYALMTASDNHINSFTTNFLSNCQNKEQETKFGQLPVIDLSLSRLAQNIPSKTGTK